MLGLVRLAGPDRAQVLLPVGHDLLDGLLLDGEGPGLAPAVGVAEGGQDLHGLGFETRHGHVGAEAEEALEELVGQPVVESEVEGRAEFLRGWVECRLAGDGLAFVEGLGFRWRW